jgi:WD40-like Beta Propeller Repeat
LLQEIRLAFRRTVPALVAVWLSAACATGADAGGSVAGRRGPWLGEPPPGAEPVVFAPGIVSTSLFTRDLAASPDGTELYWGVIQGNNNFVGIAFSRLRNGRWSQPELAPFARNAAYRYMEPHISPDGSRFFFVTNQPHSGHGLPESTTDIWVMDREGDEWGPARPMGEPVNSPGGEYFPSVTRGGVLYFTRRPDGASDDFIYRAVPRQGGGFEEPVRLPDQVNAGSARYNAFIDPDERFLIIPIYDLPGGLGATDYWICFRERDGTWTDPVNLGDTINTAGNAEYSASLSADGRYFFFMSVRPVPFAEDVTLDAVLEASRQPGRSLPGIWWVDAGFLETLRP